MPLKKDSYGREIVTVVVGLICIHAFLLAETFQGPVLDAEKASHFGSFIGGYVGTMFGLVSVVFLWTTLRKQISSSEHDEFENRFFQLIKYHRENVAALGVGGRSGSATFVTLIREFREAHKIVTRVSSGFTPGVSQLERINLAYMAFYYGTGPNSSRLLRTALKGSDQSLVNAIVAALEPAEVKTKVQTEREFAYVPFEGHQSRLGHYYRQLFQTVKYVEANTDTETGMQYADLLRSQLSNHEQALLCLNAAADIGSEWRTLGFIAKFQLIKNVPEGFFDRESELDLAILYPNIQFEYMKPKNGSSGPNREKDAPRKDTESEGAPPNP